MLQPEIAIQDSNRRIQYCGNVYTALLQKHKIHTGITKKDHHYENAMTEYQKMNICWIQFLEICSALKKHVQRLLNCRTRNDSSSRFKTSYSHALTKMTEIIQSKRKLMLKTMYSAKILLQNIASLSYRLTAPIRDTRLSNPLATDGTILSDSCRVM
jgi:hypothetical protein